MVVFIFDFTSHNKLTCSEFLLLVILYYKSNKIFEQHAE